MAVAGVKPRGGAYVRCVPMGDGSVRVARYDTALRTIFFETGDVLTQEQYALVPAVQFDGGVDEDCGGLDFWVSPTLIPVACTRQCS